MIFRLSTTPGTTSCSRPEYRSSVFSRKMARSSGRSLKARLQARQHAHRAEIDVQAQLLAQRHVDALVAAADGRGGRPFQPHAGALPARRTRRRESAGRTRPAPARRPPRAPIPSSTPVASTARTVASATSGPMPSPGISVIWMRHHRYYRGGGGRDSRLARGTPANGGKAVAPARHPRPARAGCHAARFRARNSCPPSRRVCWLPGRAGRDRLRPDHLAALHDRADGRGPGTDRRRNGARSGRRLRICGRRAGPGWPRA